MVRSGRSLPREVIDGAIKRGFPYVAIGAERYSLLKKRPQKSYFMGSGGHWPGAKAFLLRNKDYHGLNYGDWGYTVFFIDSACLSEWWKFPSFKELQCIKS